MSLKLKPNNHREDSQSWETKTNRSGQTYKVNPEGDIWEYDGEQYFTFNAVQRLKLRVPSFEEIEEIKESQDLRETLGLNGCFSIYHDFILKDRSGYYWISKSYESPCSIQVTKKKVFSPRNEDTQFALSVRLIDESLCETGVSKVEKVSEPFLAIEYKGKTYKLVEIESN